MSAEEIANAVFEMPAETIGKSLRARSAWLEFMASVWEAEAGRPSVQRESMDDANNLWASGQELREKSAVLSAAAVIVLEDFGDRNILRYGRAAAVAERMGQS